MIALFIPFALKSLLIAGLTLGLLRLLRDRSAAERNMVAHFGLLALLIMPLGSIFLPQLVVSAPVLAPAAAPVAVTATPAAASMALPAATAAPAAAPAFDVTALWPLLYGVPAALLLIVTLLAVLRLLTLRARASVLVEPSWISALAHAQRRMDFKNGTALLSSSDLKSPISWGVLRPVILINDEAIGAHGDAEAIIAHELAHVRGLDWAKLLLARIVSALFWFNPLVWLLAREAHQLREETADDAVLAADVANTDYAQLLVGVARHECRGILLASHGVAPAKNSLSRRVRRVLDQSLPRTPVARGFGAGLALGVVAAAAPLAALTLVPSAAGTDGGKRYYVSPPERSLPAVVAASVARATTVTTDVVTTQVSAALAGEHAEQARRDADQALANARQQLASGEQQRATDAQARANEAAIEAQNQALAAAAAERVGRVEPGYAAQIRAAAPGLKLDNGDLMGMQAVGVSPDWLRAMIAAGYQPRDAGDLTGARAVGVSPAYVAELAREGYRGLPLSDLTSMRAMGVDAAYIRQLRQQGHTGMTPDQLVQYRAMGIATRSLRAERARPPALPRPPSWRRDSGAEPPDPPEPPDPVDHD
ncbi:MULTISPECIES: M56 family metallopeptidase [Sphingomonas]|uniref:M56 family metallopeptidase n=1 Tax=Sphingomonas TaxID=13687 RepID=UPI000DEEC7F3|nr:MULTISPECIES: M56 family metallopeptidase [Sphingomonas]